MQTEIRIAIVGRENGHGDFRSENRTVDMIKKLVSRFHVLAIQEWTYVTGIEIVVKQSRDVSLCVGSSVVDEHIMQNFWFG